jgi:hypothetical protein
MVSGEVKRPTVTTGRGEAADRHHRLGGHRLDVGHVGFECALLDEARDAHLVGIVGDVDVPEVGQLAQQREHVPALAMDRDAVLADPLVRREAYRDGAVAADRLFGVLDHFADQTNPVFQVATVLVGTAVGLRRQEVRQQVAMGRIDVDDVETRLLGALGRFPVPAPELANVRLVHGPGLERIADADRYAGHVHRDLAAVQIARACAAEPELGAGQRAVLVHRLGHQRMRLDVGLVPEAGVGIW